MTRFIKLFSITQILSRNTSYSQEETIKVMTKKEVIDAGDIKIYFPNFDFNSIAKLISYTVSAYIIAGVFSIFVKGTTRFTDEVKELIRKVKPNERLYIEDIRVRLLNEQ